MAIPTYDALMLPVLRLCNDQAWVMRELIVRIADDLCLSDLERAETIPSGRTPLISSRVHWAKTYLKQAGLLFQPKRGLVEITKEGREFLSRAPDHINRQSLETYPQFQEFLKRTRGESDYAEKYLSVDTASVFAKPAMMTTPSATPDDQIAEAARTIEVALQDELREYVLNISPSSFERLILDLLLAMGYGGARVDAGERLGGSGDGGVDGVIREDRLGLDQIYLQAKRYNPGNSVDGPTVQAFIGALINNGAQKGVLITTSTFTKAAREKARQAGQLRVVLIDGEGLMQLMTRFNVGVRVARSIEIKAIDLDYFGAFDGE